MHLQSVKLSQLWFWRQLDQTKVNIRLCVLYSASPVLSSPVVAYFVKILECKEGGVIAEQSGFHNFFFMWRFPCMAMPSSLLRLFIVSHTRGTSESTKLSVLLHSHLRCVSFECWMAFISTNLSCWTSFVVFFFVIVRCSSCCLGACMHS